MYISLIIPMGLNLPKPGDGVSRRGGPSPESPEVGPGAAESASVIEFNIFIYISIHWIVKV